jgi:uncharacterized protein YdeI (YjbR/CyaY-like superfamily)
MNKQVDRYIVKHSHWQAELELLREILLESELVEEIKWGVPIYTLNGKHVVGLGAFKSHVGLWFFQGAMLSDKSKVLINAQEGKTKALRQWRFASLADIERSKVRRYIEEAIDNQKVGKVISPAKPTAAILPDELIALLASDDDLKMAFEGLTPYKQNEYAEYIVEAKREATKISRLEKIRPMIVSGIGLNDRYR